MSALFMKPIYLTLFVLFAVTLLGCAATQSSRDHAKPLAGDSITATVASVDAESGLMQLNFPEGKTMKMAASTKLLDDLKAGQHVNVVITNKTGPNATGMPAGDTSLAEVQTVDLNQGFLRLLTTQGEIVDLRPGRQLLEGLQVGDQVQIGIHPIAPK